MKNLLQTLSFGALLSASAVANAVIVEVQYVGVVDYAVDSTFSAGDPISGSLFINTDVAPPDYCASNPCDTGAADYFNGGVPGADSNFVTGIFANGDESRDFVYLQDNGGGSGGQDDFQLGEEELSYTYDINNDPLTHTGNFMYVGLGQEGAVDFDFITGTGLEQTFMLNDPLLLGTEGGFINRLEKEFVGAWVVVSEEEVVF
ncbi:MAG: hypothetical protein HKO07_00905, partial [Pseudomonadales bacterium]|nr:hypothetical protein [Pseudomonadales bacterium]